MYTDIVILNVFERSLERMHLFDQNSSKNSNIVLLKYYYNYYIINFFHTKIKILLHSKLNRSVTIFS